MTAQDFYQYLEEPKLLYALPLTELQQLALRYPYSPNLRLLLLLKTKLDKHPGEQAYLERCAAAAFDRGFLYDLLQELDHSVAASSLAEETDTLELKELDELQLKPELMTQQAPPSLVSLTVPPDVSVFNEGDDLLPQEEPSVNPNTSSEPIVAASLGPPLPRVSSAWVEKAASFHEIIGALPTTVVVTETISNSQIGPASPSHFYQLRRSGTPSLRQRLGRIRQHQQNKTSGTSEEVNKIARRSLVAHEAVASETLAQLLVRQGQYQHAIKMYRRLILLYPDKKTIFAGLIKELKEKL